MEMIKFLVGNRIRFETCPTKDRCVFSWKILVTHSDSQIRILRRSRAWTAHPVDRNRVEDERRSLIIEKRGTPRAVLLSIRDYVKLAAPEPEILRIIGEESERNGTTTVTSRQIDQK
jgi:prevent-host-death family protein